MAKRRFARITPHSLCEKIVKKTVYPAVRIPFLTIKKHSRTFLFAVFFWRRQRDSLRKTLFCYHAGLANATPLRLNCLLDRKQFTQPFESLFKFLITQKALSLMAKGFFGGGRGIRTPVGVNPNGFQDRLVVTASICLRTIKKESIYSLIAKIL